MNSWNPKIHQLKRKITFQVTICGFQPWIFQGVCLIGGLHSSTAAFHNHTQNSMWPWEGYVDWRRLWTCREREWLQEIPSGWTSFIPPQKYCAISPLSFCVCVCLSSPLHRSNYHTWGSGYTLKMLFPHTFGYSVHLAVPDSSSPKTGVIILPTETRHYKGNPSKWPTFTLFDPKKKCNLMISEKRSARKRLSCASRRFQEGIPCEEIAGKFAFWKWLMGPQALGVLGICRTA